MGCLLAVRKLLTQMSLELQLGQQYALVTVHGMTSMVSGQVARDVANPQQHACCSHRVLSPLLT